MLELILEHVYKNKKKLDIWFKYISIIDIFLLIILVSCILITDINGVIFEETILQTSGSIVVFFALLSISYFIIRAQIMNVENDILVAKIEYSLESYAVPFIKVKLLEKMNEASDEEIKDMCSNIVKETVINHEDIKSVDVDVVIKNIEGREDYKIVTTSINIEFNSDFYSDKNIIKNFVWLTSNEKSYIDEVKKSKI